MKHQNFLQQQGYRTLVLWVFWAAAALSVYLSFYQNTDVWSFVQHDRSRITWIIMVLFALGVFASFVLTMVTTFELIRVGDLDNLASHQGLAGLDVREDSRRIVDGFFAALKRISREANARPDTRSLIEIELGTLMRVSRTVELLGNILITLGLIGTVMGLTLTLTGLTGSLEALGQDQDELLRGLRMAMGGMGTAFYTTLLGAILGGVLLRVFGHINESGVETLADSMSRICLVHCAVELQPSLERDLRFLDVQIQGLGSNVQALRKVFDDSGETMLRFQHQLSELRRHAESEANQDTLRQLIAEHQEYTRLLRHEVEIHNHMYGSLWQRIKALFGFFRR